MREAPGYREPRGDKKWGGDPAVSRKAKDLEFLLSDFIYHTYKILDKMCYMSFTSKDKEFQEWDKRRSNLKAYMRNLSPWALRILSLHRILETDFSDHAAIREDLRRLEKLDPDLIAKVAASAKPCPRRFELALRSYEEAKNKLGGEPTGKEAYRYLKEYGSQVYKDAGIELPELRVYLSYLSQARSVCA